MMASAALSFVTLPGSGAPIVFVTAYCDADTLERIHTVVPAAPVLSKPVYRQTLADAVSAATQ